MYDQNATIDQFLAALSARQSTPSGGSAAALAGAAAAAIGQMVLNFSVGKTNLLQFDAEQKAALAELARARVLFVQLMAEDQAAFEALAAAKKLPDGTPDRRARVEAALLTCIRVPQALAAAGVAMLEVFERMVAMSNRLLLSDLATGADLAMAAVRTGVNNVKVNVQEVPDAAERAAVESATSRLLGRGLAVIQRLYPRIWQREGERE